MRALALLAALACLFAVPRSTGAVERSSAPWLVISDIHFAPYGRRARSTIPSYGGEDTNPALFDSLLAELVKTDPAPPVVIIAGDFLGHGFPVSQAAKAMAYLANRFDQTFPHAQFVIALGNNDSSCGDYETTIGGPFLRDVARAWEPLVDRGGAAPAFRATFSHDGGYVARLPRPRLRAVVVNDVYASLRYRNACGTSDAAAIALGDLANALSARTHDRTWLVTHIPPGIDAYSTAHLVHRLVVVPFMRPGSRERLLDDIGAPEHHVTLVIAGHTHHFSFRLSDARHAARDVPILVAPSVSPVFSNGPSFLSVDVGPAGDVGNIREYSFDHERGWRELGDLATQGVPSFTAPRLLDYAGRLAHDAALRATYVRLYAGGADEEIDERNWTVYRCAITEASVSGFRACSDTGGLSVLTGRALDVLVAAGWLVVIGAVVVVALFRGFGRRRHAKGTPESQRPSP